MNANFKTRKLEKISTINLISIQKQASLALMLQFLFITKKPNKRLILINE